MASFFQQILTILTTQPGNMAYHLVVAFSVAWALQSALTLWRTRPSPPARRMVTGLSALLGLRLLLFGGAIVAAQGWVDFPILLPTLDRLVTTLGVLLIAWLWAYPEPERGADAAAGFFGLFVGVVFLLNLTWGEPAGAYNESGFDLAWEIMALAILVFGSFLLIVRRPNQWETGLAMLGISMAGHLAHFITPLPNSDLPGAVRAAQMAAYPLLIALSQRFLPEIPAAPRTASQIREGITAAWEDWLGLQQSNLPDEKRYRLLARALAGFFEADAVGILLPAGERAWQIACSYQRKEDAYGPEGTFSVGDIPILNNALRRKRPLRLPASSTSIDLHTLWERLNVPEGHLLAAPVISPEDAVEMGLVLLSGEQSWSQTAQTSLLRAGQALGEQKVQESRLQTLEENLQTVRTELEAAQQKQQEAEAARQRLEEEIAAFKAATAQQQREPPEGSLEALLEAQETAQEVIHKLQEENRALQEQLSDLSKQTSGNGQVSQLERELRTALSEVARLQQLLSEADRRALLAQKSEPVTDEQRQALTNLAQELRQPMSSILGYTDLLLGESVGILGALQRKFLERIRASIERMGTLIEDLIQIVTVGKPPQALIQSNVPLNRVVDKALAAAGPLMREKNIALRLDLPRDLPTLTADQESLQQALFHLLQNATLATPPEGEVTFRIRLEHDTENEPGFVLLQVSDQGGGIHPDDLPRVFSRLYRSENTPIEGLGDNGTGLTIAKTLIENQDGRVWVDSQEGIGATFSVLLPLAGEKEPANT